MAADGLTKPLYGTKHVQFVDPTAEMAADGLTNPLYGTKHLQFVSSMTTTSPEAHHEGLVEVEGTPTADMAADGLSKPVYGTKHA
jgi:hypothetical protein